jgi:hypothetical protein
MPSLPDIPDVPGKSLITGMRKRTRMVAAAAAGGALAVGGLVAKRVLGHGGDESAAADPIAETPTAPPGAEEKPVPKPKPAKPKAEGEKAKATKGKGEKANAGSKPKPPKSKPMTTPKPPDPKGAKPPKTTGTDAPPKPEVEPGNQTGGKDPHHARNNPVVDDPDLTEYPDPYDN